LLLIEASILLITFFVSYRKYIIINKYKFVYYEIEISSLSSIIDYKNEKNHI